MLEVLDASASYTSATIIMDVSLKLAPGEVRAILGRNGVGKSTLLKYIAGVIKNRSGEVRLDGTKLNNDAAHRAQAGLAYVPQGREIFPRLTTLENIQVSARACGKDPGRAVERMLALFPALGERSTVMGGNLSGGQQQILALARALAMEPKVILLDEPTEGIQPSIIDEIHDILVSLNREQGVAMLIAEQNIDFINGLASVCYLMNKGVIEQELPTDELFASKTLIQEMLAV